MSDFADQVRREEYQKQAKNNYESAIEALEAGNYQKGADLLRKAAKAKENLADIENRLRVAQKHRDVANKWRSQAKDYEQGQLVPSSSSNRIQNDSNNTPNTQDVQEEDLINIEPESPNIDFSDVGGMTELKKELVDKIATPIEEAEIYNDVYGVGSIPGALLQGPPGSGKTHITKALAGELNDDWSFIEVDLNEVTSSYIGKGAKNVAAVFDLARKNQPCILFFDEIDSIAGNRADSNSQTHSERQMLTTMLTEMNDLDDNQEDIVVIGATNDPESVDDALLNPKRLKEVIEVPLPDAEARKDILRIELRDVPTNTEEIDLERVVERTKGFSASDMSAVAEEARRKAAKEASKQNKKVPITQKHIDFGIDDRIESLDDAEKGGYIS